MNNFNHSNINQSQPKKQRSNLKSVEIIHLQSGSNKKELTKTMNTIGKLKGNKRDEYIEHLVAKDNSIEFASDLLKLANCTLSYSSKLDQEVIKIHQEIINKLFERLDKIDKDSTSYVFEITMVYNQISDLSKMIQQIRNDWKNISQLLIFSAITLAGVVVNGKLKKFN